MTEVQSPKPTQDQLEQFAQDVQALRSKTENFEEEAKVVETHLAVLQISDSVFPWLEEIVQYLELNVETEESSNDAGNCARRDLIFCLNFRALENSYERLRSAKHNLSKAIFDTYDPVVGRNWVLSALALAANVLDIIHTVIQEQLENKKWPFYTVVPRVTGP